MEKCDSIIDFQVDRATVRRSAMNSIAIQLIFKLKGLVTVPVMTYFLVPKEMGVFSLVVVTSTVLTPLFSMNLTDGPVIHMVQERSRERIREMYDTVVNGVLLFSILFGLLFWIGMYLYGREYYRYTGMVLLLLYSGLAYKTVSYVLAVFQKTTLLVRNALFKDVTVTVLTVALVVAGFSYYGLVLALVAGNLLAAALVWRITRRELPYRPRIDGKILSTFLSTSLPLLPVFLFSWVIQSSDSYFLAYFKGEGAVGKYSVVYGLTNIVLALTYALNFFWFPVSARMWVEDREKYGRIFKTLFMIFTAVLLAAVLLFEFNSRTIMRLIVRNVEYHDAHIVMGIIAFAFAMQVLITLLTAPLYSNRNVRTIFFSYLAGGAVNALLNFLLIPGSGIAGAAVSTAVSYLAVVLIMGLMNYRAAGFAFLDSRIVYVSCAFLVSWAGLSILREFLGPVAGILSNVPLILVLAFASYMLLKKGEREYIFSLFGISRPDAGREEISA